MEHDDQVPVFDIGERTGATQYVDIIDHDEVSHPVMKFVDKFQKSGIIMSSWKVQ